MAKQETNVKRNNIGDQEIYDSEVNDAAAIQEKKLALNHTTNDLYDNSVRLDVNREIPATTNVTVSHLIFKDQVLADTYWKLEVKNGEVVMTEVSV